MAIQEDILDEFDKSKSLLDAFRQKMEHLTMDLLRAKNIQVHNVSSRLKEKASLETKILKKKKYASLSEITDVIGIRIITLFENEVDRVAQLSNKSSIWTKKIQLIKESQNTIDLAMRRCIIF